jgi:type I restriction enzyme S subunit
MDRRYCHYRETGVPWLGTVPTHWNVDRLKWSVAASTNGVWGDEPDGVDDVICLRVADFDRKLLRVSNNEYTFRAVPKAARKSRLLGRGDLLIEKSGGGEKQPVGAVVEFSGTFPAVCSNFIARLVPSEGMHSRFWAYLHAHLYSRRVMVPSIKQTTGIQNLDTSSYFDELVAYPPLEEQRDIASYLDRETQRIDELVGKKLGLLKLLDEKQLALISKAVTQGLEPSAPFRESKIPWLGSIPAHWQIKQLRHVARAGTVITYGIVQAGPDLEGGIPYIRTSDMDGDELPLVGYLRTSADIDASYSRSKVATGDLVIAIRATIGKPLIVPSELDGANLTQGTAKFSPGPETCAEYVKYFGIVRFWTSNDGFGLAEPDFYNDSI